MEAAAAFTHPCPPSEASARRSAVPKESSGAEEEQVRQGCLRGKELTWREVGRRPVENGNIYTSLVTNIGTQRTTHLEDLEKNFEY